MEISPTDYDDFREILERQSGILLGENKQYLVASRLACFVKENHMRSLSDLLQEIARPSGKPLLQTVIDQMTTNETLWFRDNYPFEYIKRELIPQLKKQLSFRIWCAACSSGQEPYSLAMLLDETSTTTHSEIIATDLSLRVIQKANEGIYQEMELKRGLPQNRLKRYFSHIGKDLWQINPLLKNSVRFQSLNLLSLPYNFRGLDIILCRNVLIYFSQENKTRVLNGLIDSLKPGGYLFLGASESLTRDCKPLEMVRCNPGLVYRKRT